MLAIVNPILPLPDTPLRPSTSSRLPRHHLRRPILSSTPTLSAPPPPRHLTITPPTLRRTTTAPSNPPRPPQQPPAHHHHHQQQQQQQLPPVVNLPSPSPPSSIPSTTCTRPTTSSAIEIHSYPTPDLLRLLASLLAQIATTNDRLAANPDKEDDDDDPVHPPYSPSTPLFDLDPPIWRTLTTASRTAISTTSSTLTFHARNIPTISLEAYLLRILKYCPTTNEVFLSLLVYFDRMSKISSESTGKAFVIDSYNIHRLVIAGVTVASKFFSDVFYTNSRYAKVGGLPLTELNLLELQFLLLNDFRLAISGEEMQRYAEQLVLFSQSEPGSSAIAPTLPAVSAASTATASPSCPSRAMGAMDAYGGHILSDERSRPHLPNGHGPGHENGSATNRTPFVRSRRNSYSSDYGHAGTHSESAETEGETTETETDAETDDEPTIRPAHSSASIASEDGGSLYGSGLEEDDTGDEGGDEDDGEDDVGFGNAPSVEVMESDTDGDSTPERRPAKDEQMASP